VVDPRDWTIPRLLAEIEAREGVLRKSLAATAPMGPEALVESVWSGERLVIAVELGQHYAREV
jgi:hypothetical protein